MAAHSFYVLFHAVFQNFYASFNKKAMLSQGNRAMPL